MTCAISARHVLLVVAVVVSGAFAACGDSDAERIRAAELADGCLINTDCQTPLVCAFRRCHTECEDSRDCPEGERCVPSDRPHNVCLLESETQCVYHTDCPAEHLFCASDFQCREQCRSFRDCVEGQVCVEGACADVPELVDGGLPDPPNPLDASIGQTCSYNTDCMAPLVCKGGSCLVECLSERDCPAGWTCSAQGGCVAPLLPDAGPPDVGPDSGGAPDCFNGVQDPGETDVDCGGPCGKCDGAACTKPVDCASRVCLGLVCSGASCFDGQQNGTESDIDCGGSCTKCPPQKGCWTTTDCLNGTCVAGLCMASGCTDGTRNGTETDVDCGGTDCSPCANGEDCLANGDCASGSCLGLTCVADGPTLWFRTTYAYLPGMRMARDSKERLVIAGGHYSSMDLGGGMFSTAGSYDAFLASFTTAGAHVFSRTVGSAQAEQFRGFGVSSDDEAVIVTEATFGPSPLYPSPSCDAGGGTPYGFTFGKYDAAGLGTFGHCRKGNSAAYVTVSAGATDAAGDIYVAGTWYGVLDFGGTILTSASYSGFLAKFSGVTGDLAWVKKLHDSVGGSYYGTPNAITTTAGGVHVAGTFYLRVDFGDGVVVTTPTNTYDMFVATFDPTSGTALRARAIGGGGSEVVVDLEPHGQNLLLVGHFPTDIDFGAALLNSQGFTDIFVALLSPDLSTSWAKSFGGASYDELADVAVATSGEIALTGKIGSAVNFGGGALPFEGGSDIFLTRLGPTGAFMSAESWGGPSADEGLAIAYVGTGLAFAGQYAQPNAMDLGTGMLPVGDNTFFGIFP